MKPKERIIVALDETDVSRARKYVQELMGLVSWWKLGPAILEQKGGAEFLDWMLQEPSFRIMLDRKFYDIPSKLAEAISAAAARGIQMLTVHIHMPTEIRFFGFLKDAISRKESSKVLLVGKVSGLRSYVSFGEIVELADAARTLGADGIICVAEEAGMLRAIPRFGGLLKVVPAIRPWAVSEDDQCYAATPREAILAGADYIVVGRPLLHPPAGMGLREAFLKIAEEVDRALALKLKMPER